MEENKIKLTLKMPPSVNIAYNWKEKRVKSDVYKYYTQEIKDFFFLLDRDYKIIGDNWLEVKYTYYFSLYTKEWRIRVKDLWNYEKTLSDVLAKNIEGFRDERIKILILEKIDSQEEKVEIEIKEI